MQERNWEKRQFRNGRRQNALKCRNGTGRGGVRMKILVIGGSYFFGRVFVMQAVREHEITVVNRGTYSMAELGAQQIKGDRRDVKMWQAIREDYDVIVDFCAYEQGDITCVLENMAGKARQYILISTVDVYARGIKGMKGEDTPLETRDFPGEAGSYIAGKAALEREIREVCGGRGVDFTALRPAILYGPFNYAPRESAYIQMMVRNHVLPHITDASGAFQFLYIKDAAEAVCKCLLKEQAYGQAYNLCQDGIVTYELFFEKLKNAADIPVEEIPFTVAEAQSQGIPLPFPLSEAESELCSNEKSKRELGMSYTDFQEGMARTYRAFKGVYGA